MIQDKYHKGPYSTRKAAIRCSKSERGKNKVIYLTVHCCKKHRAQLEGFWLFELDEQGKQWSGGPDEVIKGCYDKQREER